MITLDLDLMHVVRQFEIIYKLQTIINNDHNCIETNSEGIKEILDTVEKDVLTLELKYYKGEINIETLEMMNVVLIINVLKQAINEIKNCCSSANTNTL